MDEKIERVSNLFNEITAWIIVEIIIAALVSALIIKATEKVLPVIAEHLPAALRQLTMNSIPLIRVFVLVTFFIWLIPTIFNITLQNFIIVGGALSVAIGFALKDISSAVIAGFVALFEKPYRVGDWVRVGEDYGEVTNIGMRAFQIRTPADDTVTIPHDRIWADNVSNSNDGADTLMCVAHFYVARGQATEGIADHLRDVARTSVFLDLDKKIYVVTDNTPIGMTFKLKAYPYEPRDQFAFISDLTTRGNAVLLDKGIAMTSMPIEFGV